VHSLDLETADGLRLESVVHPAARRPGVGSVVAAHDLTLDLDQGGMFMRLAERLSVVGFDVLRFSFRGHGGSQGAQRDVTVAGQVLDLRAATEHVRDQYGGPTSIVAVGLAAVAVLTSLADLGFEPSGLALWAPVLDPRATFVEPTLRWGVDNLGPQARQRLDQDRFVLIDGEFELGRKLFDEMGRLRPDQVFLSSRVPALVAHGDHDDVASPDVARRLAGSRLNCHFHPVWGADHGFDDRAHEDVVLDVTTSWLTARHPPR
jgi:pimeloyl-ACP methyl ester carboxylesterase